MIPPPASPPTVIDDRYRVERLLGAGGMGAVYACKHTGTRRACAVKVILADTARRPQALERFMREASAQGAVKSDHVVDIFDVGLDRATGNAFMAMELLSGEDLGKYIERHGKIAPELVLRIAAQALTGLAAAHAASVVHRDLKPANLFLAKTGKGERMVKLLDFGIAKVLEDDSPHSGKLTKTGMIFGSPSYMSPEQASGAPDVDHRSDIWSFGAVMYEALTGAPPYHDSRTLQELIKRIWAGPPEPLSTRAPDVPADVAAIVTKAMTHDPAGRYQSAAEMLAAVNRHLPGGSQITDEMLGLEDAAVQGAVAASGSGPVPVPATTPPVAPSPVLVTASGQAPRSEQAPLPGGTEAMQMPPPAGATQNAFARTADVPGGRRWLVMGAVTAMVTVGLALLVLQFIPKPGASSTAAPAEASQAPSTALHPPPAVSSEADAPRTPGTATPADTASSAATVSAASTAPAAVTAVAGTSAARAAGSPPARSPAPKPKSTDPFSGRPISKDSKP